MIKNFTIDNIKFNVTITDIKPDTAEEYTDLKIYKDFPELIDINPEFKELDESPIKFFKDNSYYYIQIRQANSTVLKNNSSSDVEFDKASTTTTSEVYLRFSTEQELSFFITRHIFPEIIESYIPEGDWSDFTTTKEILDWWKALNGNKNMFDPNESICYGKLESPNSEKGKGYNKHEPVSYYNNTKTSWDRDLPNLVTSYDEELKIHVPLTSNHSLESWYASLPNVVDGQKMFMAKEGMTKTLIEFVAPEYNCTTYVTYCDLPKLEEGQEMFKNNALKTFQLHANKLIHGNSMFENNVTMEYFGGFCESLVNGRAMFKNTAIEGFCMTLPSLTNGFDMFKGCRLSDLSLKYIADNIRDVNEENKHRPQDKDTDFYTTISISLKDDFTKSEELLGYLNDIKEKGWTVVAYYSDNVNEDGIWSGSTSVNDIYYTNPLLVEKINVSENLCSLVDGTNLFASTPSPLFENESLVKFVARLSSLEIADNMFYGCTELRYFKAINLGKLHQAFGMFSGCFNMTQFDGDLSALEDGEDMFYGCKLGVRTLQRIANTIKTHSSGTHKITIGMNCKESEYETSSYKKHIDTIKEKGWEVLCGFNK